MKKLILERNNDTEVPLDIGYNLKLSEAVSGTPFSADLSFNIQSTYAVAEVLVTSSRHAEAYDSSAHYPKGADFCAGEHKGRTLTDIVTLTADTILNPYLLGYPVPDPSDEPPYFVGATYE